MNTWDLRSLELQPRAPAVLSSTDEARAILLHLPSGEGLPEHQVHERAWVLVVDGELEIVGVDGTRTIGRTGQLTEFAPGERHAVHAREDTRLLVLLTPWPAPDHPSARARASSNA